MSKKSEEKKAHKARLQAAHKALYGGRAGSYRKLSSAEIAPPKEGAVPQPGRMAKLTDEQLLSLGWSTEEVDRFRTLNEQAELARAAVSTSEVPPAPPRNRGIMVLLSMAMAFGHMVGARRR